MDRPPPTVYLLAGNNRLAITEFIGQLHQKLGDQSTADMNTQRFSGAALDFGAFAEVCQAIPFISARRLVILNDAERIPKEATWREQFFDLIGNLPVTTALILIDDPEFYSAKRKDYVTSSPHYLWHMENEEKCFYKMFTSPRGASFTSWISDRCRSMGGEISSSAAEFLTELVAEDPDLAHQEVAKLLDYVDRKRAIEVADVEQLTPFRGQSDIFELVDLIGHRKSAEAQEKLHRLLIDQDSRYVFAMVLRQFRLILQAREALDQKKDLRKSLRGPDFVLKKVGAQARNFSLEELERIYHELLSIDLASKTSQLNLDVALHTLIAALSSTPQVLPSST